MRSYWLGFTRKFTTLAAFLLLVACGGGDGTDGGNAARDADSKGGPTAGVGLRGGGAPIALPGGNAAAGGALSSSVPGNGAAASGSSSGNAASDAEPPPPLAPHVPGEVIVKFREGVPEVRKNIARNRVAVTRLRAFRMLEGLEHHRLPANLSVAAAIAAYRKDPDVQYAEPNYIVRTTVTPNDSRFGELWGLNNTGQSGGTPGADIKAQSAWDITTGSSSVVVAVIDTGIDYNHPDLTGNMFRNTAECIPNGVDDDGNGRIDDCHGIDTANGDSDPLDDNRHGTHVGGTIGGMGNNDAGVVGVNWNVSLMPCKFLDAGGFGSTSGAIACLDYIRTMKERGANIVATNNSWGGGAFSQALFDAIQRHQDAGILFIAAAGNGNFQGNGLNNDATPFYPCNYRLPHVICVAATTRTDERATFSNYGRRTVHIGAPGVEILSTALDGTYTLLNGTSMATPHVSGVAALLKAADPTRDWRAIKNLILAGGDGVASMSNTISQKRLNALGALTCSNSTIFSRLTPVADNHAANVGAPVNLSVMNINCAAPNGDVSITVEPGGESITLVDDGVGLDQAAGDGTYSGQWAPASTGSYTLTFPDGSVLSVTVSSPVINVTPDTLDFGNVNAGTILDRTFTVQNTGSGVLNGNASATAPFTVLSGGSYSLAAGQSTTISVRFSPTSVGTFSGAVTFTGGGGTTKAVVGVAVPPATLAVSPASVSPGATVTATWGGIAAPSTRDWIGIFAPGAPDTSYYLGWRYTTGAASGSVPFTIPTTIAPGAYELRLFSDGRYTRLALINITVVAGCTGGALNVSPASVAPGGSVTASWSAVCAPTTTDWIGLYLPGAHDSAFLTYRYTTGTASGSVPFTIPTSVAPGTYELRLFSNNSVTRLAVSNSFSIIAGCTGPSLSASPQNVAPGNSVTISWSSICAPTTRDWIALATVGASPSSYFAWRYTTGTTSGSVPLTVPATLAPGTYELRLFANGGYTQLAVTTIAVGAGCTGPTLGASPSSVIRGNAVTGTWNGICAPTAKDWIGIYLPGAANASYVAWRYTTGTASGNVPLTVPATVAPGTYELRLFANNGYTRLGTSNTFAVTSQ